MNLSRAGRSIVFLVALVVPGVAAAQSSGGWGRVNLWGQVFRTTRDDGTSFDYREVSGSITLRSATADDGGLEYGFDGRGATYPETGRDSRLSLYEAWVGGKTTGGIVGARVGQMWLNDLGALGALGGVLLEAQPRSLGAAGRFRIGVFGGLEPKSFDAGYVPDIRKMGGYVALDGERGRRHVAGWVVLKNAGLTERSVLTLTNFVPVGREFFLYQALEYDLVGPAGGKGGLTYTFANVRYAPVPRLELQGNYHRGRSIDTRSITLDVLAGRPVDPQTLQGFLFESYGGRVTVEALKGVRLFGGLARDRSARDEAPTNRLTAGFQASNLASTGIDATVSGTRWARPEGNNDSWYASLGRSLGSRVYLSLDYSTAVAVLRLASTGDVVVETRPSTRRFGFSGNVNLGRSMSLMVSGERVRDDTETEVRAFLGIGYRF